MPSDRTPTRPADPADVDDVDLFAPTSHDAARTGVESTVHAVLRAQHGPGAVEPRPISATLSIPVPTPTSWVQAAGAAVLVQGAAESAMKGYARKARGAGATWHELGAALGFDTDRDLWPDPGMEAFRAVAERPSQPYDPITVRWDCQSCGQIVTDSGPHGGHPADTERGHAEDCARHRREIAAYLARVNG